MSTGEGTERALAVIGDEPMPVAALTAQVAQIEAVRKAVMRPDVHYGEIPGCKAPVLFAAGAEKLQLTFRLAPEYTVEDLSTAAERRYRVTCTIRSIHTGSFLGNAVAECSSEEEKYAWRRALNDEEYEATAPELRRVAYKRQERGKIEAVRQIHTVPADQANTVLAMASKRAQVRAVRGVLAASDLFADGFEARAEGGGGHAATAPPTGEGADYGAAGRVKVGFGKHKGKTLADVMRDDRGYVEWLAKEAQTKGLRDAAWACLGGAAPAEGPADDVDPGPSDGDVPPDDEPVADPFADQ